MILCELYPYVRNPLMPSGNKRSYVLKQTFSFLLEVCLSACDLLLPPGFKGQSISGQCSHFISPGDTKKLKVVCYFLRV